MINPIRFAALVGLLVTFSNGVFAVEIIAHRGASYDAPENTLAAFKLAFQQNADAVECDIHYTTKNGLIDSIVVTNDTIKRVFSFVYGVISPKIKGSAPLKRSTTDQPPTIAEGVKVGSAARS